MPHPLDSSDPYDQLGEENPSDQQGDETSSSSVSEETTFVEESPSASKQAGIVLISVLVNNYFKENCVFVVI